MPQIGVPELLLLLGIIVILFGVGRIGKIAGELGSGIRAFREGLRGDDKKEAGNDKAASSTTDSPENKEGR